MSNVRALRPPPLTEKSSEDRIHIRGLESEISLAQFRARKHRDAGRPLQASIQDDIATEKQQELVRFLNRIQSDRKSCGCAPRSLRETARETIAAKKIPNVKSPTIGKCRPYIRIERDEEAFAACNALAEKLGPLDEPEKVFEVIGEAIGSEVVEVFGVISLDIHKRLRGIHITGRGEEDSVMAPIKSTIRAAVVDGADSVIIFHIHPSGVEAEPSEADIETTQAFVEAFETVEICLLDHIIIGGDIKKPSYYSFLEDNAL